MHQIEPYLLNWTFLTIKKDYCISYDHTGLFLRNNLTWGFLLTFLPMVSTSKWRSSWLLFDLLESELLIDVALEPVVAPLPPPFSESQFTSALLAFSFAELLRCCTELKYSELKSRRDWSEAIDIVAGSDNENDLFLLSFFFFCEILFTIWIYMLCFMCLCFSVIRC